VSPLHYHQLHLYHILTFVVVLHPDPRVPRQPDPERPSRRDISEVVDKRLGDVGVGEAEVERSQISTDRMAVAVRLEPGRNASCPGRLGLNHIARREGSVARLVDMDSCSSVQLTWNAIWCGRRRV